MIRVITLPDNEKFIIDFENGDRDIENVVADFCGEEFATELMNYIDGLKDKADYEELKFNSDMGAYEAENEDFRGTLQDTDMLLKQYEHNVIERDKKIVRTELIKFFNDIHRLIGEVI